jgi:hypothetical protein
LGIVEGGSGGEFDDGGGEEGRVRPASEEVYGRFGR